MSVARTPHPIYAALWGAWSVFMIVSTFLAVGTVDVVLWATWSLIEGSAAAINTGMRDTQSEIVTWVHRHLAKGPLARVPYRGWNALLFIPYIALIVLNVFQLFQGRGFVTESAGVLIAASIGVGLWEHWINPDDVG